MPDFGKADGFFSAPGLFPYCKIPVKKWTIIDRKNITEKVSSGNFAWIILGQNEKTGSDDFPLFQSHRIMSKNLLLNGSKAAYYGHSKAQDKPAVQTGGSESFPLETGQWICDYAGTADLESFRH